MSGAEEDQNVERLPVRFKDRLPDERTVMRPWEVGQTPCDHRFTQYIVSEGHSEVTCARCNGKLNPMWVLGQLATRDRRHEESQKRYQAEMQRLSDRQRTKCQHCKKMTRISRP